MASGGTASTARLAKAVLVQGNPLYHAFEHDFL